MYITYDDVKSEVHLAVRLPTMHSIIQFIERLPNTPKLLWAITPPTFMLRKTIYLCLYHDRTGIGYDALSAQILQWYRVGHGSLRHNIQLIRKALGAWGKRQIKTGNKLAWDAVANLIQRAPEVANINLLMDSFDLLIEGRHKYGRKSPWFSGKPKMMRPALRWMAVQDLQTRFRMLSTYYSPKIYDGHYVLMYQDWFSEHFSGSVIAADQHFSIIKKNINGIDVQTTMHVPEPDNDEGPDNQHLVVLSDAADTRNRALKGLRAQVEQPFGHMQNMFHLLRVPWREEWDQFDALVHLAAGVHNYQL